MVIDCNRVKWRIKDIADNFDKSKRALGPKSYYSELMHEIPWPGQIVTGNAPEWNHIEKYEPETKLIHYTIFPTQPWKTIRTDGPAELWYRELRSAVKEKMITPELLELHKSRGFVNAGIF